MNKEHNSNHSSQSILDQRAENMGFRRQPSPKDGECFFFSLALQISNLLTTCDEKVEEQFNKLGIKNEESITEIANVLQLPLVLVTSVTDWPLTIVTPQAQAISNVPLYLAFTQEESGHYDSLIELSRPQFVGKCRKMREIRIKCR